MWQTILVAFLGTAAALAARDLQLIPRALDFITRSASSCALCGARFRTVRGFAKHRRSGHCPGHRDIA
jgi:hypothetical protein